MNRNNTDRDLTILKMWSEGKTGSEIAEFLGTTRSSILGRLYRLREKGVDTGKKLSAAPKPQSVQTPAHKKKRRLVIKRIPAHPTSAAPKKTQQAFIGITITQLTNRSCRYILNDGESEDYLYCGQVRSRGAYCNHHAKMCYISHTKKSVNRPTDSVSRKIWSPANGSQ